MEQIDALETIAKSMRRASLVDAAEQRMLEKLMNVVFDYRAAEALGVCGRTMSEHRDGAFGSQDSLCRMQSSVCLRDYLPSLPDFPNVRRTTLEFKVHTVPHPDFDWLNDTEEPAAVVKYRKTPIPKRAPPSEEKTMQGAAGHSPVRNGKEQICSEAGGRVDRDRGGGTPWSRASPTGREWAGPSSEGVAGSQDRPTGRAWEGFGVCFDKFPSRADRRLDPGARPKWI
ncbi:hypothetical protein T484DRAFT_1988701 [Baffinella frigidus]|nr:hypothetical protein T484DRAFT_1988701 [Cryptophyta sp. CCMP2293]